jgi:hypothetical protein
MTLSGLKKAFNRTAVRLTLGLTLIFSGAAVNIDGYNRLSANGTIELVAGAALALAGVAVLGGTEIKEKKPKV